MTMVAVSVRVIVAVFVRWTVRVSCTVRGAPTCFVWVIVTLCGVVAAELPHADSAALTATATGTRNARFSPTPASALEISIPALQRPCLTAALGIHIIEQCQLVSVLTRRVRGVATQSTTTQSAPGAQTRLARLPADVVGLARQTVSADRSGTGTLGCRVRGFGLRPFRACDRQLPVLVEPVRNDCVVLGTLARPRRRPASAR